MDWPQGEGCQSCHSGIMYWALSDAVPCGVSFPALTFCWCSGFRLEECEAGGVLLSYIRSLANFIDALKVLGLNSLQMNEKKQNAAGYTLI